MFDQNINSLMDLCNIFNSNEKCIEYLEEKLWNNNPVSPYDKTSKVYKCRFGYKCTKTDKYFNVKINTIFDNTKLPLQKWFCAIWMVNREKKGISACRLSEHLGITIKTAWTILQKIRHCCDIENGFLLKDVVEADETFVGGKNKNRHKDKKVAQSQGRSFKDKIPVLGMLQRNGKLTSIVIDNTQKKTVQPLVKKYIERESILITDEWLAYTGLNSCFDHNIVNHARKEYVNSDNPFIHSNTIEGFWGTFKRGMIGIYNHVSKKHMQLYVDEFVYRYNTRKLQPHQCFNLLISNTMHKMRYKDLIDPQNNKRNFYLSGDNIKN